MIIFDLDGTLADCEHRRHFVDWYKTDYSIPSIYEKIDDWRHRGIFVFNCAQQDQEF